MDKASGIGACSMEQPPDRGYQKILAAIDRSNLDRLDLSILMLVISDRDYLL
jgi:hypothetical protein